MPSTLPAGFVLDQEGPPEGFVLDQPAPPTQATPAPAPIERPSSFLRRAVGDTAVDLGKGVVGVGEAAVGLGNLVSGGYVGKGLEAIGYDPQTTKKMLEEGYTHERVAANKAVSDAKGFVGTAKALIENPSSLIGTAVESAPLMLGGGAVARGGAALLGRAGSIATPGIRGAAAAIPHTTAGRIGLAAAGEGLVGAGSAAEGIRQQSDDGLLSAKQTGAALASGAGTAALGALGGKVAQKLGIADVDVALAGGAKAAGAAPKNILRRTIEGMVSEGLLEELPQSMQEQMWQNVALDKPLMEGVPEAAAAGALAGGLMGGGFSAISRPDVRQAPGAGQQESNPPGAEGRDAGLPDTSEPLSGVAAPLGGEIIPQQPAQAAQEPKTPAAQMAANMRMQAQVQRANAKTVLGRAAADATDMQADAVAADPFDLSDMGATPNDEAPVDGFTRLGVIAQDMGLDPEAIVSAARADVGDDPQYSLDGLDDRILTIYAQSLAPTVQSAQAQDGFPSEGAGGSQPTPVQAPSVEAQSGQANPVEGGGLAVESPVAAGDDPALASVPAAGAQAQEVSTASNAYPQGGAESLAVAAPEQPEYDQSEDILDSDITTPSGTPFTIRDAAERAAARHEGGRVFPVDGGFVVRVPSPQASSSGRSEAPQPVPVAGQAQAAPAPAALPVQEDRAQDAQAVPGSGLAAAQAADSSPSPQATPAPDSPQARQAAREANVPADLLAKRDAATERLNAASAAMQQFPAGDMGLTPDAVKATPEWKAAKIELDRATVAARNANAAVVKASKAKPAKAAPPAASDGIDEAAVRAAYNAAMQAKTGVTDFDYGKGTFGDLIVGALKRDPEVVESARSSLINGSNETGLRVFFQQAGMKMPRTQREQRAAFDAYIGVTPEQRAARDKAKADSKASQAADKAMKSARSGAASVSMHSPDGQSVDGATWVDGLVAEGYSIIVQRGAATYLAKRDGSGYKMPHKAIAAYARLAAKSATEAKPETTTAEQPTATHADPGEAPEAVTPAVIADAAKTAARAPTVSMAEARKVLLAKLDAAIKAAPANGVLDDPPTTAKKRNGRRTWDVDIGRKVEGLSVPAMTIVESHNGTTYSIGRVNTRDVLATENGLLAARLTAARLQQGAEWAANGKNGGWTFTPVAPVENITLDVPGDGTFKVRNTKERLTAFRKQVESFFKLPKHETPKPESLTVSQATRDKIMAEAETVDEAAPEQPAPSPQQAGRNGDDWLGEFFTPEAEAEMQERRRADEDRRKAIAATLRAEADQARATAADWAGRKYKGNNKTIQFEGDGPGREFQSIGSINEARRHGVIQQRNESAAAIDALADRIERGDDADIRAHIAEANTSKNLRDEAERDMFAGRPFGGGDTSGPKSVGGILRAAYAAPSQQQATQEKSGTLDGRMWDSMSEDQRDFLFYEPSWRTPDGRNVQAKAKNYLTLPWDRLSPAVQSKLIAAYELREVAHGRRPTPSQQQAGTKPENPDNTKLTVAEARKRLTWRAMGTKNGTTSHALFFDDGETSSGMRYGEVERYTGGKWEVDGGGRFESLADAKREAVDLALVRLQRDGYIESTESKPAKSARAEIPAKPRAPRFQKTEEIKDALRAHARAGTLESDAVIPLLAEAERRLGEAGMDSLNAELNRLEAGLSAEPPEAPTQSERDALAAKPTPSQQQADRPRDDIDVQREEYEARRAETAKAAAGKAAVTKRHRAERLAVLGEGWNVADSEFPAKHTFKRKDGNRVVTVGEGRFAEGTFEVTPAVRHASGRWEHSGGGVRYFNDFAEAAAYANNMLASPSADRVEGKKEAKPDPADTKPNTEDAGEELWANRRNSTGKGLQWADIEDLNPTLKAREAVKSKVWPRPNYEQLVEGGIPAPMARIIKSVYDALATKPQTSKAPTDEDYQAYISGVQKVRDAAFAWARAAMEKAPAAENKDVVEFGEKHGLAAKDVAALVGVMLKRGGDGSMLDAVFPYDEWADRSRFRGRTPRSTANNDLALLLGGRKLTGAMQVIPQDIMAAIRDVQKGWPSPQEAWEKTYTIHEDKVGDRKFRNGETITITEPSFWIASKQGRFNLIVAEGFKTREDAAAAAKALYEKKRKKGGDGAKSEAPVDLKDTREGPQRRQSNEDITSDQLKDTFGFKGVNFGNWMKGTSKAKMAERQAHLNNAYDSMLDLAEILNIPPKAISLNGMLGLAIGAQGHGGRAAAHFVPGVNEINLTRGQGAGSLAHEWAHGLDHYFATLAGGRVATGKTPFLSEHTADKHDGVRPEVQEAFKAIVKAMRGRDMTAEEAAAQERAMLESAKRSLDRSLTFMRDGLANGTLKTGTGRSRENVLATFDELATRLRNGDLGEGYLKHGKGFNDSEPQVVAMLAMLYRESLGYKYQEIPALGYNARRVAESGKAKQSNATHIPQVPSNFRREALKLDKGSTGKYWSSTLEMFARSFQSYVLDRLAAQGARNDYLTRPQMDEATLKAAQEMGIGEDGDRYPRGDERNAINRGFDTLVASLRTRETDGGNVALENVEDSATEWLSYMEADESRTGGDFDADRLGLRGAVNALLGKSGLRVEYLRGYAGLPDNLRNAVESRNAMGRKGQTAALYDPASKRAFVFTHVVRTPERAAWNAAHEIAGHDGLRKLLGKRLDEVLELAAKNPTVAALADEIAVQRKLRGDQRLLAVEEALAELAAAVRTGDYGRIQEKYRIEVPEGIRARIQQVVENFIRRLKELLQNRTGVAFKDADVRALLENAWQAAQVDSAIGTPSSALESTEDGPFGPIYESPDFEVGIDTLLREKNGELKDGMFHPSIGYVDVVYGERGTKAKDYEDGYGLAKIAAKHPEVYLHNLADELSRAPNPTIRGNTATFDTPTYTMVVKRDWKGDPKNWLLTAFEPKSAVSGNTRIGAAAAGAEARSGQDTAAADSSMESTENQTQGNPSILESVEDFTLSDDPAPQDARIPGEIRLDPLHKVGWKGALQRLGQKFTDLKPAALALVPLQEMDDFTPKDADGNTLQPAVRHYIQLQNAMQAMRNGMYVQYDKTAQDLHAYSTAGSGIRGFFGKAVNQQGRDLFALMHDSTIAGIDPSEENVRYKEPEKAAKYRELQERFSALPDDGKRLFNEVRDAYAKQTDLLDEVIEANAMRAAEIATNRARRKLEERERDIEEDAGLSRAEKAKAKAAARKSFDDAVDEGGVQSKIMALRSMLEANRVPKPYFPLKRYGKFWVSVLKDGKLEGFSKFESAAEQEAFSRQMVAQGYQTRLKYQDDAVQSREMIDPKFVAEVEEILTGLPDQVRDDVWQAYLERMPDMSLRKSFIHRKNVPGYHFDALKAFGSSMFHGSYQIARLKYGMEMQEAIDVAKEQANALRERDSGKALAADMVAGELDKRHAFIMNPTNAQWAQKVNGAAFLYSLGANPAHLFLNATQTVMIGVPVLGSRYGFRRASAALGKAAQDFAKGRGHLDKSDLTQDEKRAFREMQASGIIEKTQAHDIAGIGSEGVEYNAVRKKVMDKIGWFMHQSERFNREVTAIAAYRLARSAGKTHDAALAEASKRVYEIHFDYSNAARARIMQGDVAKALLVFRNYQTNMLYRLFRDIHQSIRGESVQVKREARRQLGAIFGMYGLFAGTMGVPFYGLAMALAGAFDDDDDPVTAEQQFVNGTVEFLGPTAAKVLLRGLPGTLFDVDLTERIGLGNLWFRSPQQEMEGRDAYYYWMEQLLGAGVSPVKGVFDGINLAMRGQIQRGIERAAPAALRNPLQAIRQAQEGGVTSLDGDLIKAVSGGDIVTKALGFTALSVAEQYEKNSQIKGADRRLSNRRQRLMNRYFLAIQMSDDTSEALADIHAFSLKNPEYAITRDTLRRSAKARARNSLNSENGIVMTRRMRRLRERMEEGGED